MQQKKVLIAPLDWGLGHATRCIPIVTAFIERGYHVTIATEGAHEIILREAFPGLTFLRLKGYGIRYSKNATGFTLKMIVQIPRILYNILREFWWLHTTNRHKQFDLIISDNRLGFFHLKTPSVFITHQLNLQTPLAGQPISYNGCSMPGSSFFIPWYGCQICKGNKALLVF